MSDTAGLHLHVRGIVQGVGFRPFVYGLARRLELTGWVKNTSAGVDIEVDGQPPALDEFVMRLRADAPPLARIDEIEVERQPSNGFETFEIILSEAIEGAFIPISPDVGICSDCLRELFDPRDRRYRYPFINCTNCGPRFTIITDIPYDRPKTTMASFAMCPECRAEYDDPADRRFHAQPTACPACGPHVWLEAENETARGDEAIFTVQRLLAEGKVVAIKGLGGFHLACDATNGKAVGVLRQRKLRVDKPFALMAPDIETIEQQCFVSAQERELLTSRQRPIVILQQRPGSSVSPQVAPSQKSLGIMLPYTPLHYLLFSAGEGPQALPSSAIPKLLVMTSGNLSEEPIAIDNDEARQRLTSLADAFLMHDRPIRTRCDDSVVRVFPAVQSAGREQAAPTLFLRRSRGYAPDPLLLHRAMPAILATGSELKNTFCLTRDRYAFLSHHIGDMENYETLQSFEDGISHFERLFRVKPDLIAHDLHPNYLATRYALEYAARQSIPAVGVQHHHAHIAACLAEHGLEPERPVIGISFDGSGYGLDGAIWGGEFLLATYRDFTRAAHLAYSMLPGGDKAIHEPWRMSLSHLQQAGIPWDDDLPPVRYANSRLGRGQSALEVLDRQLRTGLNSPLTSSMGRLFDAAASLAGLHQTVNYEAQAAVELEALADPQEAGAYHFSMVPDRSGSLLIEAGQVWRELIADRRTGTPLPTIAARFHNGVAHMVLAVCIRLRQEFQTACVVLSGGVWQNVTLLSKTTHLLAGMNFDVYTHHQVPPNDGGLSLGQAVIAASKMRS
jgi:hydrogenase maturation protein HypF